MKRIRVAIFGAPDSGRLINKIASESFSEDLEPRLFVGRDYTCVAEEVLRHQAAFDALVGTGIIPYCELFSRGEVTIPTHSIGRGSGTSLYRALFNLGIRRGLSSLNDISIDVESRSSALEVFNELDLSTDSAHIYEYSNRICLSEVCDFHHDLWKRKQTQVAVTSSKRVYELLEDRGVPAYRILPTRSEITATLRATVSEIRTLNLEGQQIALIGVRLKGSDLADSSNLTYGYDGVRIKLHQVLHSFTITLDGSLIAQGSSFFIFTHRSAIRGGPARNTINDLIKRIREAGLNNVSIGIGYADTVNQASQQVLLALKYAENERGIKCIEIGSDNEIIDIEESEQQVIGISRVDDEALLELSEVIGLGVVTLNKLANLMLTRKSSSITARDLAGHLQITDRRGRRILQLLTAHGYARIVGHQSTGPRGRPTRVYQIELPLDQK